MDLSGKYIAVEGTWGAKEIAPISELDQLLANNKFENWTADDPDNWSIGGGGEDATNYITKTLSGQCRIVSDGTYIDIYQTSILTAGKFYKIQLDVTDSTLGTLYLNDGSVNIATGVTGVGVKTYYHKAANSNFRIIRSGACDITLKSVTIEEVPEAYPLFDKGDTYLAGIGGANKIAFPCRQAFGRWEFLFYKDLDTSSTTFNFVCGDVNGTVALYKLIFLSTECIRIRRDSTNIMESSASYIEIQTWYKLRITRTKAGVITFEIMGGAFGIDAWTLIDASVTGTNPLTDTTYLESQYIVVSGYEGDRIAKLVTNEEIVQ